MLHIRRFTVNPIQENTYVIHDNTKETIIIDCGSFYPEEQQALVGYIKENRLKPVHLLCTHGHLDHCFGNIVVFHEFGLKPEVMAEDDYLITKLDEQARKIFGFELQDETPPVGKYLSQNDIITFGNHQFTIIPTPGHTPGSCVFYCKEEKVAFTGDTLFHLSIGRTDFERGCYSDMMKSLQTLKNLLPAETIIYSGHGPQSSMGLELRENMYLNLR